MEKWKDIKDYEGLYEVSTYGRVRNKRTGRVLKVNVDGKGYLYVQLYKHKIGLKIRIHRIVAQAFIPNPENKPQVNHIDENKRNNHVSNLEWCTHKENINHGTRNKRSSITQSKPIICVETNTTYYGISECARRMNLDQSRITKVLKGRLKTTGGYTFKYVERGM